MNYMNIFKPFRKWFWVGFFVGILNSVAGLIVGAALLFERDKRPQGVAVILWSVFFFLLVPYINTWIFQNYIAIIPMPITSIPWLHWLPTQ